MFNDLGLNANYNMKRERLNTQEVSMNIDALMPFVDSMLTERVEGVKRVNEMFGTDITVTLGSSWKIEHENYLSLLKATEDGHDHTETEDVDPVTENETEETQETEETESVEEMYNVLRCSDFELFLSCGDNLEYRDWETDRKSVV